MADSPEQEGRGGVTGMIGKELEAESGPPAPAEGAGVQIVVTVNGPGEVACWLYPLATELKRQLPGARICVAMVPCVFSTGSELSVLKSLPYIDASCSIAETRALILLGRLPEGFDRDMPGFILHLGGDSLFTWLISRRLGQPCLAYAERPLALQSRFEKVFYSGFEKLPPRLADEALVMGEMMVDAARMRCPERRPARSGPLAVGLFPGSRDYMAKYLLPFYARIAETVAETMPDVDWMMAKSDFLSDAFLRDFPDVDDGRPIEAVPLKWEESGGGSFLVSPKGIRIGIYSASEVAARANVVLTLPGSNTAELSAAGVPMVVTVPTWSAEKVPLPGLAGHIGRLPLIGKYIKRAAGFLILRRLGHTSHPNRRTGRMVVPEVVGRITAAQVAREVVAVLRSDTRPLEEELRAIMGPPGATRRLVGELLGFLKSRPQRRERAT